MDLKDLRDALNILVSECSAEGGSIEAEHEEIAIFGMAYPEDLGVPAKAKLRGLGWDWDEELECWRAYC